MKTIKYNLIILISALMLFFGQQGFCAVDENTQISKFETSIWGFIYSKDDVPKRLARIENNIFGTTFQALTPEQRIKKINEAMGFESYEDSVKDAYELSDSEISGINYPQIDKLEYQLFLKTYEKENIYKRLDRLESKIFGSTQDGNLATRTDRLQAYIKKDVVATDPMTYNKVPYHTTQDVGPYMGSQAKYDTSDIFIQLSGLETAFFSKTYSQDPVGLRLNRLERKIFQRDFSSDDDSMRLQRLQAAASATQTAKLYEANKVQKYASTGLQIGSILLMILALIL